MFSKTDYLKAPTSCYGKNLIEVIGLLIIWLLGKHVMLTRDSVIRLLEQRIGGGRIVTNLEFVLPLFKGYAIVFTPLQINREI